MNNSSPETPNEEIEDSMEQREIVQIESDFGDETGQKHIVEVDKNAPGLFLFDIDGTLIDAKKVHGPALVALFNKTFGEKFGLPFDDPDFRKKFLKIEFSHWGVGDRLEFFYTCSDLGITFDSEEEKEKILDEMTSNYGTMIEEAIKNSSQREREEMYLPGVLPFLEEMKKRKIPAALVTGNVRKSAEAFAKYIGFGKYFITGGYDDDPTVTDEPYRRATILKSAVEKCKEKGIDFLPNEMAVFGDTPKDFEATLHQGDSRPYTMLFATGDHNLHTLGEIAGEGGQRPHIVAPSFQNLKLKEFFDGLERFKKNEF